LPHEQRRTAKHLAEYVNAHPDDVVQVEDATSGINAVLQSLLLHRNDTNTTMHVLVDSFAYPSVRNTLQYVIDGPLSIDLDVVQLPFPVNASTIREEFRAAFAKKNYTLVMVDHISSVPAVIFPVKDIVEAAHENGALIFVDGAHAVGQLPLNLTDLGADFYVSNTHKWLCAQRSAAFLHVAPAVQHLIHPDAISNHYGEGFLAEFDYIGTRDYSTMIGQRYALELREKVGDHEWRTYNNDLCDEAAAYLSGHWDSAEIANEEFSSLVMVGPLPYKKNDTVLDWDVQLMYQALVRRGIWTVLTSGLPPYPDNRYFRISCQVYNVLDDYKFLAKQFDEIVDSGQARK
jgi:isopenicillin-N epimerase